MRKKFAPLWLLLILLFSCASVQLEKTLNAEEKEFLSYVRYIITREERKAFLRLPPSERKAFIEEFWQKRDPDPETEVNEYKEEFFKRIEEANHLFGGTSGWLQDRGRVYVLLGPPHQREVYPRGIGFYDPPSEIWYYGFYRLVFIDHDWSGNYQLEPQSARLLAQVNVAQLDLKSQISPEKKRVFFDFDLEIQKDAEEKNLCQIKVPYKNLWFVAEGDKLQTALEVTLTVFDSEAQKVWEEKRTYPISLSEEELKGLAKKDYLIEIKLPLRPGTYQLEALLKEMTGESQVVKKIKLTIIP
jgi:GWxTD domain-containing protein